MSVPAVPAFLRSAAVLIACAAALGGCDTIDASMTPFPSAFVREVDKPAGAMATCAEARLARLRWPVPDRIRRPQRSSSEDGSTRFLLYGFPDFAYRVDVERIDDRRSRTTARVGSGAEPVLNVSVHDVMARLRSVVNDCAATS